MKAAAILLAAGLSRRMGERNKLLIEIGGEPLVRRMARMYLDAGLAVHAVLGYEANLVREALAGLPITSSVNGRYEDGQASSARAGVDSLHGSYEAVMIALADQAALTSAGILELLNVFRENGGNHILIPYHSGRRGNPVVFPGALLFNERARGRSAACRSYIEAHPELTRRHDAASGQFVLDIDTPADLAAFETGRHENQQRAE